MKKQVKSEIQWVKVVDGENEYFGEILQVVHLPDTQFFCNRYAAADEKVFFKDELEFLSDEEVRDYFSRSCKKTGDKNTWIEFQKEASKVILASLAGQGRRSEEDSEYLMRNLISRQDQEMVKRSILLARELTKQLQILEND